MRGASIFIGTVVLWSGCISTPKLSTSDAGDDGVSPSPDAGDEATPLEDAPSDDPAQAACLAACPAGGTCEAGTCVLACPGIPSCATGVTCPPGIPCRVTCTGMKSCGTVDCGTASTCKVDCNGDDACKKVTSGASHTDIACTGKNACPDTSCGGDVCSVQCNGMACKPPEIRCCATTCTVNGTPGQCK